MYQNYTINQLCLPIDLEIKLEENDFAHAIVQFVDSIPDEVFLPYYQSMGRPQYHPRMLLSIILCAYIQGVYSGRQIQNMLIDSIRMRYLSQDQIPNFRTINRFRVHPIMNDILDHSFIQFRELLVQSGLISGSALYIDGTKNEKIESKETASYYAQRKIDVETVFGNIKQNMKFKRFHVRGAEKIFKEVGLVFLAQNFRKLVIRVRKYEGKTIIQNQI